VGDDSQTAFLRTRLKLRCIERAAKARERAVQKKRLTFSSSEAGSDDMEMEEDGDEDDFMFDEVRFLLTLLCEPSADPDSHSCSPE
jgi:hypothetical protein